MLLDDGLTGSIIISTKNLIAKQIDQCAICNNGDEKKVRLPSLNLVASRRSNDRGSREELR